MPCPRCWGSLREPGRPVTCGKCAGAGKVPDVALSPHFALSELVASQTAVRMGLANDPSDGQVAALTKLAAEGLEVIRAAWGAPLHIDSGYRSPMVNAAIGGAVTSAHRATDASDGECATDVKPVASDRRSVRALFDTACSSLAAPKVPYDQIIFEYGTWVHVSLHGPHGEQRGERLMIFTDGKGYVPFDPNDPRVQG